MSGLRILIAEDDARVASVLDEYLRLVGYRVFVAHGGRQALETAAKQRPQAAIIDLAMPDVSGLDVIKRVWASRLIDHIAVLSGCITPEIRKELGHYDVVQILQKPQQPDQIAASIERMTTSARFAGEGRDPVQFIRSSLSTIASLGAAADQLGVSSRTLQRRIKQATGMSFSEFLTCERIDQAKRRLTATDDLVKEIAFDLGFGTQQHFSRTFRRHVGVSPGEFRAHAGRLA